MLRSLMIRQIALIDEAQIHFCHGMQVLTGETGAGKSIVVDAVNLILGGRADREMIRTGSDRASVEAVFDIKGNDHAISFLVREEIEHEDSEVTVYREITTTGKNTCRICGILVPLSKVREFTSMLMDLHGQSEHQFLADPETHLSYLDQTGGADHIAQIHKTQQCCDLFLTNHKEYARLVKQNEQKDQKIPSLEHDIDLLRKAKIRQGEVQSLVDERKRLESKVKNADTLKEVSVILSGDENTDGCLQHIRQIPDLLKGFVRDGTGEITQIIEKSESLYYEMEEMAYQISTLADKNDAEPDALDKIDRRLDLIHRLERKFGVEADELPSVRVKLEEQLSELNDIGLRTETMAAEHKKLLNEYRIQARALTESRKRLARIFESKMMKELTELGMGNTVFQVNFKQNDTGRPLMPSRQGDDHIEFLISANPGEPLKPLSKVASGGELSRIMLAVKTMESAQNGVDSMVFDEIDTGISGRMAQVVAEKMVSISRNKQVICVTHLPQIAAVADNHFLVRKQVSNERTLTSVNELDYTGRTEEVSRMISGADGITAETIGYGERLLKAAEVMKSRKTNDSGYEDVSTDQI